MATAAGGVDEFVKKFIFPIEPVVEISADKTSAIRKRIKLGVRGDKRSSVACSSQLGVSSHGAFYFIGPVHHVRHFVDSASKQRLAMHFGACHNL